MIIVRREQEAARAAGRIADRLPRLRRDHIDHRGDERTRREVLARAAFHVLGVLLQQALVGVALHVGVEARPLLLVDQVDDQPAQLGRVLDLVLRLAEDDAEHARPLAEFLQRMAVMDLQIVAVQLQQRGPAVTFRNRRRLVERRLRLLVRHFQEQQKRQLLDVVAVGQAVIAQDVAVVPEFLNESRRVHLNSVRHNLDDSAFKREWPTDNIDVIAFDKCLRDTAALKLEATATIATCIPAHFLVVGVWLHTFGER